MLISGYCLVFSSAYRTSKFPRNSRRRDSPPHSPAGVGFSNLRLAVISPFVDKQHGTERVLAELLQQLAVEHGVDVALYSQRVADLAVSPAESPPRSEGVGRILWRRVSSIPRPHLFQFIWWYFANRFARWRDKTFRGFVSDLLYSPGINASDADAITVHIVFHAFYEQVRPQLRLRSNSPIQWPLMLHRILYYRLMMALERRIYRDGQVALSAVSALVAKQLESFFGRTDVLVVRHAVDTHCFNRQARLARRDEARAAFSIARGEFVFLLVGNDWKIKGVDAALRASTECLDLPIRLLIVGNDHREPFLQLCEQLGLCGRVNFLEPSKDVLQFYAAADAYLAPSLEDSYGLPILESMACGLPVIASSAAGASEIIVDGENGLLLRDPRDVKLLASVMRKICVDSDLGSALGAAAERTASRESWETYAARMLEHFQSIAARKNQLQRRR